MEVDEFHLTRSDLYGLLDAKVEVTLCLGQVQTTQEIQRMLSNWMKQNKTSKCLKSVLFISCVFWIFFQNAGSQLFQIVFCLRLLPFLYRVVCDLTQRNSFISFHFVSYCSCEDTSLKRVEHVYIYSFIFKYYAHKIMNSSKHLAVNLLLPIFVSVCLYVHNLSLFKFMYITIFLPSSYRISHC